MRTEILDIPLTQIDPDAHTNYSRFKPADDSVLDQMASSFKTVGQQNPIVVFKNGDDKFAIEQGFNRYLAAGRAGFETIRAVISAHETHADRVNANLDENLRRQDMTPMDRAMAIQRLFKDDKLPMELIADKFGYTKETTQLYYALNKLPEAAKDLVHSGEITFVQATRLATRKPAVAKQMVEKSFSEPKKKKDDSAPDEPVKFLPNKLDHWLRESDKAGKDDKEDKRGRKASQFKQIKGKEFKRILTEALDKKELPASVLVVLGHVNELFCGVTDPEQFTTALKEC